MAAGVTLVICVCVCVVCRRRFCEPHLHETWYKPAPLTQTGNPRENHKEKISYSLTWWRQRREVEVARFNETTLNWGHTVIRCTFLWPFQVENCATAKRVFYKSSFIVSVEHFSLWRCWRAPLRRSQPAGHSSSVINVYWHNTDTLRSRFLVCEWKMLLECHTKWGVGAFPPCTSFPSVFRGLSVYYGGCRVLHLVFISLFDTVCLFFSLLSTLNCTKQDILFWNSKTRNALIF